MWIRMWSNLKLSRNGLREGHGVIYMLELLSERLETALKPDSEWDPHSELRLVSEWIDLGSFHVKSARP